MRRSKATNIFMSIVSWLMLIVSIFIGIGVSFFRLGITFADALKTVEFWVGIGVTFIVNFIIFTSASAISTNKEFESNDDYKTKVKNVDKVNSVTGLEYVEDFLEDHYTDKKYEKVIKKLKNKLERIKRRVDRNGFNLRTPERQIFKPRKWYRWFNGKNKFNRILYKYTNLKERIEDPVLKEDVKYMYVKGIIRVTKAYLSDGIKKYKFDRDPDKPESAFMLYATKGVQRFLPHLIFAVTTSNIAIEWLVDGYSKAFWIDLAFKILSYLLAIVSGYMFGKTFFQSQYLGLEIRRENLLQKYILWLKKNHPEVMQTSQQRIREQERLEMEEMTKAKLEQQKIDERAKALEAAMKNEGQI